MFSARCTDGRMEKECEKLQGFMSAPQKCLPPYKTLCQQPSVVQGMYWSNELIPQQVHEILRTSAHIYSHSAEGHQLEFCYWLQDGDSVNHSTQKFSPDMNNYLDVFLLNKMWRFIVMNRKFRMNPRLFGGTIMPEKHNITFYSHQNYLYYGLSL